MPCLFPPSPVLSQWSKGQQAASVCSAHPTWVDGGKDDLPTPTRPDEAILGCSTLFFCTLRKAARNRLCKQPSYTEVRFHLIEHSCHACWLTEVCEAHHVPPAQRADTIHRHAQLAKTNPFPAQRSTPPSPLTTPHPHAPEPSQQLSPALQTPQVAGSSLLPEVGRLRHF